jgi:hypothetical protein
MNHQFIIYSPHSPKKNFTVPSKNFDLKLVS